MDPRFVLLMAAIILPFLAGIASLVPRSAAVRARIGLAGAAALCASALPLAVMALTETWGSTGAPLIEVALTLPGVTLALDVDALSAVFLVSVAVLPPFSVWSGQAAVANGTRLAESRTLWLYVNWMLASLVLVLTARNGLVFLVAWEFMAVTSAMLVMRDHERVNPGEAAWGYLISTQVSALFLILHTLLMARAAGSLEFSAWGALANAGLDETTRSVLFFTALVAFGVKAGAVPFHVWMPDAYAVAPSFVSAMLSGTVAKLGVYGLLRTLTHLGPDNSAWGWTLIAIGVASGVYGVLQSLVQRDVKRTLAFSSVENMGVIFTGLGFGVLGMALKHPALAAAGFVGAVLHVWNHGLMKTLLFLGAGTVERATGTLNFDHLGGLNRRMPVTGAAMLAACLAIAALPPFNGFASEFVLLSGVIDGLMAFEFPADLPMLIAAGSFALVGGLAVASFARFYGITFLGAARTKEAGEAVEVARLVWTPLVVLAGACFVFGFATPVIAPLLLRALAALPGFTAMTGPTTAESLVGPLGAVVGSLGLFVVLTASLALLRARLLSQREVREAPTWDCGYAAPNVRMQYTAASFSEPLSRVFSSVLPMQRTPQHPLPLFPTAAAVRVAFADAVREFVRRPVFAGVAAGLEPLRKLQGGRVRFYVLYVIATLIALLTWQL